jgi:hypothetical protein
MSKPPFISKQSQVTATDTHARRTSSLGNGQLPTVDIREQRLNDEYTVFPHPPRLSPWYNDFVPIITEETYPDSSTQIKSSVLCSKCSPIRTWVAKNWARLKTVNQTFEHIFNHYDDSRDMKKSALSGCHLCTLFWHSFDDKMVSSQAKRLTDREKLLSEISSGRQVQVTAFNKG